MFPLVPTWLPCRAEISLMHSWVPLDLLWFSGGKQSPEIEDHNVVGNGKDLVDGVVDDQNRNSGLLHGFQQQTQLCDFALVKAGEWLIHGHEACARRQHAADICYLLDAEGKGVRIAI